MISLLLENDSVFLDAGVTLIMGGEMNDQSIWEGVTGLLVLVTYQIVSDFINDYSKSTLSFTISGCSKFMSLD